ncbi:MAG: tetratricopeptide repeat protein [Candidatus Binatia bacterium]|nr:tetratricopeptide repeat protein [Candidatus Binatia bacterium]
MTKEEYYNRGMELFADGNAAEAIDAYQQALEGDPNYPDALHALAMVYADQDRLDEAIKIGKKLIDLTPEAELAYTSLSIFYQRKGMIAEAEEIGVKARTLGWKRQVEEKKRG